MPQTMEAIHHAKAAKVPIVVALNKIDKPEANPERIKQDLAAQRSRARRSGAATPCSCDVSAKTGQGIDKSARKRAAAGRGAGAEGAEGCTRARASSSKSRLDKGRGPVATVLVQSGTLKRGDIVLAGAVFGRVRAMLDETGKPSNRPGPRSRWKIQGLSDVPAAGAEVMVLGDERKAREIALFRQGKFRDVKLAKQQSRKLENMFDQMGEVAGKTLSLIIKADVQGSYEALAHALAEAFDRRSQGQYRALRRRRHHRIGHQPRARVESGGHRLQHARRRDWRASSRNRSGVDIRYYNIIYEAVDEVKAALSGMLAPEKKESRSAWWKSARSSRSRRSAPSPVASARGLVRRGAKVRVLRDNVVIHDGELDSLKRFKDDVREVKAGFECGLSVKSFNDLKVGDQLEAYEVVEVARTL